MATEVYHKPRKKYGNSNPNLIMTRVAVENKLLKRKDYKYIQIFATTFMKSLMPITIWTFSNTYLGNSMAIHFLNQEYR